jgi:hypothetical protein
VRRCQGALAELLAAADPCPSHQWERSGQCVVYPEGTLLSRADSGSNRKATVLTDGRESCDADQVRACCTTCYSTEQQKASSGSPHLVLVDASPASGLACSE